MLSWLRSWREQGWDDLQDPLKTKTRLRRLIQRLLAGRNWPVTGEDEFFRKAVRRHELFWMRKL